MKIELQICDLYKQNSYDTDNDFLIAFVIGGIMHILRRFGESGEHSREELDRHIGRLVSKVIQ